MGKKKLSTKKKDDFVIPRKAITLISVVLGVNV